MSKKTDLIKKVVKSDVERKPTFGTDPNDPWSTKANITEETLSETALLNRYLKSRGINPEFVSKDQKVAHSKTNQFKVWMQSHVNDPIKEGLSMQHTPTQKRLHALRKSLHYHQEIRVAGANKQLHSEAVDKKDTITFDIPLLIRVLEFAREELKSDILLHKMVERLISIRGKGTLTMNQYGKIVKEEAEALGESYGARADKLLAHSHSLYRQSTKETDPAKKEKMVQMSSKAHKVFMKAKEQHFKRNPEAQAAHNQKIMSGIGKDYKDQEAKRGIGHVRDHVEVEGETIKEGSAALRFAQALKRERETRELKDATRKAREAQGSKTQQKPVPTKEDFFHGSAAAVGMPFDGANNTDDTIPAKRSNTAKIVKSMVKKIKEDIYDHEKEDKPVTTPGRKTRLQKLGIDTTTKESPQAAAVLTGGKTLTGEPRDTIEIDPMMKMKKSSPDSKKSV